MNIQRFQAPTLREALAKARRAFGDSTLILSNRTTPKGVEVVATAEESLAALDAEPKASVAPQAKAPAATAASSAARSVVEQDTEKLAMSTLSFQEYVRERMLSKRQERAAAESQTTSSAPAPEVKRKERPAEAPTRSAATDEEERLPSPQRIVDQLHAMQSMIEDRLGSLAWLGQAKHDPIQSNLLLKLVRAGYSPSLARKILNRLPADLSAGEAVRHLMDTLARSLAADDGTSTVVSEGGIFAVLGSTGSGKTSVVSKLMASCIKTHGASSVGLVSLDAHRAGAHEQLRAHGRTLGVVAHLAHDRAALQEMLSLLGNKKMVLIDTAGHAPNDPRVREAMELINLPQIKHLLALNAVSQGEAVEHAIQTYKTPLLAGALVCRVDEAVKLGPVLDAVIRHQVPLRGICTGQRLHEDLQPAHPAELVRLSMRSQGKSAFDPGSDDLALYFSGAANDTGKTVSARPLWSN